MMIDIPRLAACAAWLALLMVGQAHAQDAPAAKDASAETLSATVVALDGDDLVIDVGRERAREGAILTLYRAIEVKHPITGKMLRDRFPNGRVRVVQVGDALSIVHPVEPPPRAPIVGDKAEAAAEAIAPRKSAVCDQCMTVQAVQREMLEIFYKTLGKTPAERVAVFRAYLEQHPDTAYKTWVDYEIQYFSTASFEQSSVKLARVAHEKALSDLVHVQPLREARAELPVAIGVYVPPETRVRSVLVHVRSAGQPNYTRIVVALDERGQGRADLAQSSVAVPGFDYYVEAVLPTGASTAVFGRQQAPEHCLVRAKPGAARRSDLSRVRAVTEYVSFDGLSGRDYYVLAEGDFLLRLNKRVLQGVRIGYGHYRGEGGTISDLDDKKLDPVAAAFTYGYLEVVLALHEMFAVMPRIEAGLGRPIDESSTQSELKAGGQLRVRIGRALGTHLVLAGESTPEIGQRAFVGLTLGLLEKWPLAFEVHVTDQPVNTNELGVRAVFEVGYRPSDVFALSTRASYQGRTIDHAGPGLGLAATFDW